MKRVSLKDIAQMAGVAPSTVSFVLNGKARQMRISEALEKKVIALAKTSGYHPNQVAVSLRTGKSKILGLIVESISGHFFASLAKIIEDEAQVHGYRVVYCSTENDPKKGSDLIRMLSQRQVDGYLITPTQGMEKDIRELSAANKPLVLIDSYFPKINVPYVLVDNQAGIHEGMQHLFKQGYKKIGFVTIDLDLIQMKHREDAYLDALKQKKIAVNRSFILKVPYNSGKEAVIQAISNFIKRSKGLDAIFFGANYLGIAGLESIRLAGLRIPGDIGMICFDDDDLFRLYPPGITSIQQPVEEIAKTAIQLLMTQIANGKINIRKSQLQLAPNFIVRGSTR